MPRNCLVINLDRCTGCDSCVVSCKFENDVPLGVWYNRVRKVGPFGTYPLIERYNLPLQCQQCENPRCVEVCPTGASYRDEETGVVLINQDACIGCQVCLTACPYEGVRTFQESSSTVVKCTLCPQLTSKGEKPACVHNCPGGARFYGDLDDPDSDVSRELAKFDAECIHELPGDGENAPLTRYILSPRYASWHDDEIGIL